MRDPSVSLTRAISPCKGETTEKRRSVVLRRIILMSIMLLALISAQEAVYQGEVIGDIMPRGGGMAWINVHNGENAIGVFVSKQQSEKIQFLGNYKQRGDTVQIWGDFNPSCPEHGGDSDIHALQLEIVETGYPLEREPEKYKIVLTGIFALLAGILFFLQKKQR